MSTPGDFGTVTGTGPAIRPPAASAPSPHDRPDPSIHPKAEGVMTPPFAGQPGHGRTAFLRRQLARVVEGRLDGSYTDVFELICPNCGDYPHLDYSQVSPRLQGLRGPRPLESAVAVYHKHLGLPPWLARQGPNAPYWPPEGRANLG